MKKNSASVVLDCKGYEYVAVIDGHEFLALEMQDGLKVTVDASGVNWLNRSFNLCKVEGSTLNLAAQKNGWIKILRIRFRSAEEAKASCVILKSMRSMFKKRVF